MEERIMNSSVASGVGVAALASRQALRGVTRLLSGLGYRVVAELALGNGRRADVVGLARTGRVAIVEIKTSVADLRADHKWREYIPYCDVFLFAVPPEFPHHVVPIEAGLIVADPYQGAIIRSAPENTMLAARRRAVTLRFARAAAARLQDILDPQAETARRVP